MTNSLKARDVARVADDWRQNTWPSSYAVVFLGHGDGNGYAYGRTVVVSHSTIGFSVEWRDYMIVAHELAHVFGARDKGSWGWQCDEASFMNEYDAKMEVHELDTQSRAFVQNYFSPGPDAPTPEDPNCKDDGGSNP